MSPPPDSSSPDEREGSTTAGERLESWKAIATYLGREIRTVQRWEKTESLPVHRHHHAKLGSVYAVTSELVEWRNSRRNLMTGAARKAQEKDAEPVFQPIQIVTVAEPVALPLAAAPQTLSWSTVLILSGIAICLGGVSAFFLLQRRDPPPSYEPVFLTTYEGRQYSPSFSPDGSSVVYSWRPSPRDHFQIYTEVIGSSKPVRLTEEPGNAFRPAWSPDGKLIAFLRVEGDRQTGLWLYSFATHSTWRIRELNGSSYGPSEMTLLWMPDTKGLIVPEVNTPGRDGGLFYVPMVGGEDVRLTHPQGAQGDPDAAISPDGRQLVFTRFFGNGVSQLCVLGLSQEHKPVSEERLIRWPGFETFSTSEPSFWGTHGDLLFLRNVHGRRQIWRSHKLLQPTPVGVPAGKISGLAVSARGERLAYSVNRNDSNIWRLDARALLEGHPREPEKVVASTELDQRPQVSPDGTQLAFESDRSGAAEIWRFNLKTGENFQLTRFSNEGTGSPFWSPDGKGIVFDARVEGNPDIYTISASGGTPKRLTYGRSSNILPTWSEDGHWIYFSSSRSGTPQIWRIPASGGEAEQITRGGGLDCRMTANGEFLYYVNGYNNPGLWRVPSGGGQEVLIVPSVLPRAFTLGMDGVFVIATVGATREELCFLQFGTEKLSRLYTFQRTTIPPISFDGRFVYFSQYDVQTSTLMMVDRFR